MQQEKNAYFVPNVHYKAPKKVDLVRISLSVQKNLLKDNTTTYQKVEETYSSTNDVNLLSKDQELNFSNKNEDDDEL